MKNVCNVTRVKVGRTEHTEMVKCEMSVAGIDWGNKYKTRKCCQIPGILSKIRLIILMDC